jgi:hypothetical protein
LFTAGIVDEEWCASDFTPPVNRWFFAKGLLLADVSDVGKKASHKA